MASVLLRNGYILLVFALRISYNNALGFMSIEAIKFEIQRVLDVFLFDISIIQIYSFEEVVL